MISIILWCVAPIFNAIMDLIENENFYQSIFYRKVSDSPTVGDASKVRWNNFWYKRESWKYAKKLFGYKFDAWHLSKSMMIILAVVSSVVGVYIEGPLIRFFNNIWINAAMEVVIRGLWWNAIFSLFYRTLFRSQTWIKLKIWLK